MVFIDAKIDFSHDTSKATDEVMHELFLTKFLSKKLLYLRKQLD